MKILAIILNIIVPGVGSLIIKKWIQGIIQLMMSILAWFLWLSFLGGFFGFVIGGIAFVWALITAASWNDPADRAPPPSSGIGR